MGREEKLTLQEATRYSIIKASLESKMKNEEAAEALKLSVRQVQRLKREVEVHDTSGVIHGNRGRKPTHTFTPEFKKSVIELAKTKYYDFNFTHLSEILAEEEGIYVNRETLRQWLRPLGLGGKVRKKPTHRKRRKRSEMEGKMLFLDGSPHRWFQEEPSTLLLCVDDATGKPLYGLFQKQEDQKGCFRVCIEVFKKHGLPLSFYLDRASQFITTRHKGTHITQSDEKPTQFERAMGELGISLIFARSPQARGRIERMNGSFQGRLVSEFRVKGIKDLESATRYLNEIFIPKYSRKFEVEPEEPVSAWRSLPDNVDIRNILCRRIQRKVRNDNTISIKKQVIQLLPTKSRHHFVRSAVAVNRWVDDSYHVFHKKAGEIPCYLLPSFIQKDGKVRPASGERTAETFFIEAGERSESSPLNTRKKATTAAPEKT